MKKTSFKPTGFHVPQNYVDKIQPKGVDISSPQMEVDKDRGVYSKNYMFNGRKAAKRFGYRKVGYVGVSASGSITAMWSIGSSFYVFAYRLSSSTWLYYAKWNGSRFTNITAIGNNVYYPKKFTNDSGFVLNGRLWIFGTGVGNGLLVLKISSSQVVEDTSASIYVPTTTISIPPRYTVTTPENGSVSYELENLATSYRKNAFIGGIPTTVHAPHSANNYWAVYRVDSNIYTNVGFKMRISTNGKTVTYSDGVATTNSTFSEGTIDCVAIRIKGDTDAGETAIDRKGVGGALVQISNGAEAIVRKSDLPVSYVPDTTFLKATMTAVASNEPLYADITIGGQSYHVLVLGILSYSTASGTSIPSEIKLRHNFLPPTGVAGENNIIVEFMGSPSVSNTSPIKKATKVARFGHNNALNRAWLYGGGNMVYVSAEATQDFEIDDEVHDADEDFTYFPVDNFYKFGSDDSAVVGMKPLSESKMMLLKTKSANAPSMYFISPTMVDQTIGQTTIDQERYATAPSNTSTAGVDYDYSIANFNGDIVFFSSEHQIVGLDIEGITGDSRRAAYSRSAYIDKELENEEGCSLFAFANYLIAKTASGKGFIAHRSQFNSETRQYEWWPIDIPEGTSNLFEDNDGTLFLCTTNCVFKLEGHTDIDRYFISRNAGDLALGSSDSFTTNIGIKQKVVSTDEVDSGWRITFMAPQPYGCVGTVASVFDLVDGNRYALKFEKSELHEYFMAGKSVIVNAITTRIVSADDYDGQETFTFEDVENPQESSYVFVQLVNEYKVKNYGQTNGGGFVLSYPFLLFSYVDEITAEFSKETPIMSVWISRPVPLSKFSYEKTIKQVDVYNDTTEPAELYIGCITNKQIHTYEFARIEEFDLSNIDWENTTFDQNRVPVIYHMRRFPRKQQYFSLVQMSNSLDNSLLSGMDITFTLNGIAKNKK